MKPQALVLAGRRSSGDAVADSSGLRHRALLPIAGTPMLERVITALLGSDAFSSISVSSDDPDLLRATPMLSALSGAGRLHFHRSGSSPATSVADFFENRDGNAAVFVTTGDHPLLTAEIVGYFVDRAAVSSADFLVGLVPATVYRERFPDQPRTFIPLRGEKYSGANLFYLRTSRASSVARFWTRAEAHRKKPWKLVSVFGAATLVQFLLGRLDLAAALVRASAIIGASVEAIQLPFAEAALDVDKEADRLAVEEVFASRGEG
jgi:CTP:molybdopterin cytidylyltransferase MocA